MKINSIAPIINIKNNNFINFTNKNTQKPNNQLNYDCFISQNTKTSSNINFTGIFSNISKTRTRNKNAQIMQNAKNSDSYNNQIETLKEIQAFAQVGIAHVKNAMKLAQKQGYQGYIKYNDSSYRYHFSDFDKEGKPKKLSTVDISDNFKSTINIDFIDGDKHFIVKSNESDEYDLIAEMKDNQLSYALYINNDSNNFYEYVRQKSGFCTLSGNYNPQTNEKISYLVFNVNFDDLNKTFYGELNESNFYNIYIIDTKENAWKFIGFSEIPQTT